VPENTAALVRQPASGMVCTHMMHPATEVRLTTTLTGLGVFATDALPKGTILWILDRFDRVVSPSAIRSWPPVIRTVAERFGYIAPDGAQVVCWDHGRLVNHSCDPATVSVGASLEIALRDVRPGDEITCDYGTLNLTGVLECRCGASSCRGEISAAAAGAMCATWDGWARDALAAALCAPQPLLPFARGHGTDAEILNAIAQRRQPPLSSIGGMLRPPPLRTAVASTHLWHIG